MAGQQPDEDEQEALKKPCGSAGDQVLGRPELASHIAARVDDARSADALLASCKSAWGLRRDPGLQALWMLKGWRPFTQATQRWDWELRGHTSSVYGLGLAVLPHAPSTSAGGGRWAVSACDNTLRLWSLSHGTCVGVGRGHIVSVVSVAACTWDGNALLASSSNDMTVKLWRVEGALAAAAAAAPVAPEAELTCCDTLSGSGAWELAFAPCAPSGGPPPLLASGGGDPTVRLWALRHEGGSSTGSAQAVLAGHSERVGGLAFSPLDAGRLVSGSWDQTLRVWDVAAQRCSLTLEADSFVNGLALSGDGRLAFVACDGGLSGPGTVQAWDLSSGTRVAQLTGHGGSVFSVAALGGSSGRMQLASGSKDLTARLWDLRRAGGSGGAGEAACTAVVPHPRVVTRAVFSTAPPGGGSRGVQLVTRCSDNILRTWDLAGM